MSQSPSPISRPIFVNALTFRGGTLTVENLDHGTAYALAAAGLGHQDLVELAGPDGRVAGRAEWGALFDRLDAGRAGVLTGEETTTAAEALRDEVDRRRLAACGGHGIVHLALRPEGAIEARALDRASGGRVIPLRDTSPGEVQAGRVLVGGVRHALETHEDLAGLTAALVAEGLPLDRSLGLTRLLADTGAAARDEVLALGLALHRIGERSLRADRLVISGHSSGFAWAGERGNVFTLPTLGELTRLFPEGAARIQHLALAGCSTGTRWALDEYRALFPKLASIWGYPGVSPAAEEGGGHLVLWARATTRGAAHVDPLPGVSTWNRVDGHQGTTRPREAVEADVEATRPAWDRYLRGERAEAAAPGDRELEQHYRFLQELAGHPTTRPAARTAHQLELDAILTIWHPGMFDAP